MPRSKEGSFNRRQFIRTLGSAGAAGLASAAPSQVSIVADPADPVAGSGPARWAINELSAQLEESLSGSGVAVRRFERLADAPRNSLCILAAGARSAPAASILKSNGLAVSAAPESLAIVAAKSAGRSVLLACGRDPRGLVYALLDLADRARNASGPLGALASVKSAAESPANAVRGIARLFCSDVEDKPWYNDREMWPHYLTMLATQRFNRFHLAFGIGYDFLTNVSDAYFMFTYPYLLAVPGYNVRVPQITGAERDNNLAMLRYISEQTAVRGLEFQLGLWMHGYQWINSPHPKQTIEGLTRETHGPYCRDAVRMLLKACPAISGVTFRVHGESGVEEGSNEFWKTVFEGVATCGRKVRLDMHAKGMTQEMLDIGVATGLPFEISPKYWAEHMGLPYHQAGIRDQERPKPGKEGNALMRYSAGSRSFTRYGYADLLREDRKWDVLYRVWPGTERLLLWGDPVTQASHSRAFGFCGSAGVEYCEPLSFKGRRGSGIAGDRCAYADASLRPHWDWEKYLYTYRVWGRLAYNPDADPDCWKRYLRKQFGSGAEPAEAALGHASRILPLVTTAHAPSAANNIYWPELYFNQSIVDPAHNGPYTDMTLPRIFGNASPLDPQLFSRMDEFGDALLAGASDGKYTPVEVAQWLEDYAAAAASHLAKMSASDRPEYRRLAVDVELQAGLGRFFAAKFRAGVLYRIYEKTGGRAALEEALKQYRRAGAAWAELANRAKPVYMSDITVGEHPQLHGHWLDRLPEINADIERMAAKLTGAREGESSSTVRAAIGQALAHPHRPPLDCRHTPAARFQPGKPLGIELSMSRPVASVRLYYRHVDQAERFESCEMEARDNRYRATIAAGYTNSVYPLEYYFEVRESANVAGIFPGFRGEPNNQPYFAVRKA